MERWRRAFFGVVLLAGAVGTVALAQDGGSSVDVGAGAFAGMARTGGEVTEVAGPVLTVKTAEGSIMHIVTTDNTRVVKAKGVTAKVSDVKVGDGVMAAGILDAPKRTLHAAILFATDAAQLKAMKENLGKTYIMGRVKAINMDDAQMTVERPDGVAQTIGFDETTSFRRGRRGEARSAVAAGAPVGATLPPTAESITLADIKVGDAVRGKGSLKGGVFVPTELVVMAAGEGRARHTGAPDAAQAGTSTANPH